MHTINGIVHIPRQCIQEVDTCPLFVICSLCLQVAVMSGNVDTRQYARISRSCRSGTESVVFEFGCEKAADFVVGYNTLDCAFALSVVTKLSIDGLIITI